MIDDSASHTRGAVLFHLLFALVLVLCSIAALAQPLNHDVAWMIHAAEEVLDGKILYVDVIEVNPPLIVWIKIPFVLIAKATGLSAELCFRIFVLALSLCSILFCSFLSGFLFPSSTGARRLIRFLLLIVLLPMVGYNFGQREHLLVLVMLPYALLMLARLRGIRFSTGMRIGVGLMFGLGVALKPHFVLLWLALELFLLCKQGWSAFLRPENVSAGLVLVVYGAVVVLFVPEYLRLILGAQEAYQGFARKPVPEILRHSAILSGFAVCVISLLLRPKESGLREARDLLALAILSLVLIVLVQRKGFSYHYYPVHALTLALVCTVFLETFRSPVMRGKLLAGASVLFIVITLGKLCFDQVEDTREWYPRVESSSSLLGRKIRLITAHTSPGASIYVLSAHPSDAFPLVRYANRGWPSGFSSLWPLTGLYRDQMGSRTTLVPHAPEERSRFEQRFLDDVVTDLINDPPEMLIVDVKQSKKAFRGRSFDYLSYFSQDSRFAQLLGQYEPLTRLDHFEILIRRKPHRSPI